MTDEMAPRSLTRSDLYEAAWTEPLSRLAPKCGLTDVGLAKLCRRLDIPVPGRGYWRKLETGKPVPKRPRLPARSPASGSNTVAWMNDHPTRTPTERVTVAPILDPGALHPMAALALGCLRKARPTVKDEILTPGYMGISVLPDTADRAILIIDALARNFERRGCVLGADEYGQACVASDKDKVSFMLKEDAITGRLSLVREGGYKGRKTWSDVTALRLEKQLDSFIASVALSIEQLSSARIAREKQEAFEARVKQRKQERKSVAAQERLLSRSAWRATVAWEKATRLRDFATAVEESKGDASSSALELIQLAQAARSLADRIDPLTPNRSEQLATKDYMSFDEWYARTLALLGRDQGYKKWGAETLYGLRFTPGEAASEVDWEAFSL